MGPDDRLGIALSGGPDSLALLILAQRAAPHQIAAATVDHGLRPEAAEEATYCGDVCHELNVPHTTLNVLEPLSGNIQAEARNARYTLLQAWASNQKIRYILTAHHADDQAETFLMRLKRASGVSGLAGVRKINGNIVRPLANWRREELAKLVSTAGIKPVNDPSNHNQSFDRVRARVFLRDMSLSDSEFFDIESINLSAQNLADADDALTWAASHHFDQLVQLADGQAFLSEGFVDVPHEIQRRILIQTLTKLDDTLILRKSGLEGALLNMRAHTKTMIGNWLITPSASKNAAWHINRAPQRKA